MIAGIGTDIVEIERIKSAIAKDSFYTAIFTQAERERINKNPERAAGCFAAKEAVAKALGTGFSGFRPIDIEILNNERGKPYVTLYRGAKTLAEAVEITAVHISVSHDGSKAVAFAVAETSISKI